MAPTEPDPAPLIASISGFTWSSEESVAYEAAIEAINGAVGAYTARIHAERAKPHPDHDLVTDLLDGQRQCARAREELKPTDHAQIADTRRRYADLARRLMEGLT
ncbi:hypothetical protein [Streptomyces sp. NPDC012888]|uniref:hypothetical protein n=1 Tax=Streptomyces sp. NPDC012888 TaxID=3364855 RepID=UPI0036CDE19C